MPHVQINISIFQLMTSLLEQRSWLSFCLIEIITYHLACDFHNLTCLLCGNIIRLFQCIGCKIFSLFNVQFPSAANLYCPHIWMYFIYAESPCCKSSTCYLLPMLYGVVNSLSEMGVSDIIFWLFREEYGLDSFGTAGTSELLVCMKCNFMVSRGTVRS
jgi:hypothetical protein